MGVGRDLAPGAGAGPVDAGGKRPRAREGVPSAHGAALSPCRQAPSVSHSLVLQSVARSPGRASERRPRLDISSSSYLY